MTNTHAVATRVSLLAGRDAGEEPNAAMRVRNDAHSVAPAHTYSPASGAGEGSARARSETTLRGVEASLAHAHESFDEETAPKVYLPLMIFSPIYIYI